MTRDATARTGRDTIARTGRDPTARTGRDATARTGRDTNSCGSGPDAPAGSSRAGRSGTTVAVGTPAPISEGGTAQARIRPQIIRTAGTRHQSSARARPEVVTPIRPAAAKLAVPAFVDLHWPAATAPNAILKDTLL